jgi:hypothetical protein
MGRFAVSLTLGEAAERAGMARSTLWRRIRSGALSATRQEDGSYRIDPSELARMLDALAAERVSVGEAKSVSTRPMKQGAKSDFEMGETDATGETASPVLVARLEAQLAGLRELLEAEKRRGDELRRDLADIRAEQGRWLETVQKLALALPAPAPRRGWRFWAR